MRRGLLAAALFGVLYWSQLSPASAQWPNEPAGSTVQMDWSFAAGLTGTGGYNFTNGGFSLVTNDSSAPLSPSNVAQCLYPPGFAGGVSCGKLELSTIGGDDTRAYLGMWIFVSNPFQGHPSEVNKIWQLHDFAINNSFHLEMWGASAPYHLAVVLQYSTPQLNNSQMGCAPFDTCNLFANVASDTLSLGAWHRIEACTVASTTTSSANGVVKIWLDGVLVFNYTNANSPTHQFQLHQLDPIWGGVGSTKSPGNDYMRFDHIRLSRPPAGGCGVGGPPPTPPVAPCCLTVTQNWSVVLFTGLAALVVHRRRRRA